MANNEIIAKSEEFDRLLSGFGKEKGDFSSKMYASSNEIRHTVSDMGNVWKGNGYDGFKNNMNNKLSSIEMSLKRCDSLKHNLDVASARMREILQRLRESK